jgi:hypothetical protein
MIRVFAALDPYDICPKIREQAGAKGSGKHVSEIKDSDFR